MDGLMVIGMFGPGGFSGNTPSENLSWCIYAAHHKNDHRVVSCVGKVLPGRCDWGRDTDLMDMFGPGEDVSNELPLENARITGRSPYLILTRRSKKSWFPRRAVGYCTVRWFCGGLVY